MKIELSKIHPSPKPIRSSWDEEAMKNLSWSLREEGQVEPIGVHENHDGYVIVWGHRRVEAARRAQWTEIDAVVVPQDVINNLIQAGIENLSGEDMSADDKADWAQRLIKLGLSQKEISRRSTVPDKTISNWLIARKENEAGVVVRRAAHSASSGDEGIMKTVFIKQVLGDDLEAKKAVAAKVSDEDLTKPQTQAVAEAYRDAAHARGQGASSQDAHHQSGYISRHPAPIHQQGGVGQWRQVPGGTKRMGEGTRGTARHAILG